MQTFEELMDLATKGDNHTIDIYSNEQEDTSGSLEDDDSFYKTYTQNNSSLTYSFGKPADAETLGTGNS